MYDELHIYNEWNHNNFKSNVEFPFRFRTLAKQKITLRIFCKASKLRSVAKNANNKYVANGKCSVVSRKQAGAKSRAHTKNFAPLTKQRIPEVKVICAFLFFSQLSSQLARIICVLCVRRRSLWCVSVERSIEFGCQRVASTLRMRNISPQQQWQSVLQWDCIEGGTLEIGETPSELHWFRVVFLLLHAAFAVAFASAAAWFNSIERIPFPFIFFIVSLELIKGAQTETLWAPLDWQLFQLYIFNLVEIAI